MMPRLQTASMTASRIPWTRGHVAQAKQLIRAGLPAGKIAKSLKPKRTEGALRQRMALLGISFRHRR